MRRITGIILTCANRKWIWGGCILIVLAVALYAAGSPSESGDLWIGLQNGRHATAGTWATEDPNRTWQMRVLDRMGMHITFRDPFGAKARPYRAESLVRCGWINQNWLCHVLLYKMRMAFGAGPADVERGQMLIILYKYLEVMTVALLVYATARVLGVHPVLSAGAAVCALMLGRPFFDLRPNTSSFVFTAVMMLFFALWRTSPRGGAVLYGMIAVMILWANMHGGFVYALFVFPLMCILEGLTCCLHRRWPRQFRDPGRRKLVTLLVCTALMFVIPAVVSPFGIRNVLHPLLISVGSDAAIFRQIAEWRPMRELGSAMIQPHVAFASGLGAALVVWAVAWIGFRPRGAAGKRSVETPSGSAEWPPFELAQAGLVLVTIWMAISARRFIPLAAIVSSPYLAQVLHQSICMIGWGWPWIEERLSARRLQAFALAGAGLIVVGGVWGLQCSYAHTRNLFDSCKDDDGNRTSPFLWMSTTGRHPIAAAQFLNANQIKGIVFNEWTDGGFLAFQQTPDPQTGQPPCRVFIDGRSQAAYDVEHYIFWRLLNGAPSSNYKEEYGQVEAEAKRRCLDATDPAFLNELVTDYLQRRRDDPGEGTAQRERLVRTALSQPTAFDNLLRHEGVNVVLTSVRYRSDCRLYRSLSNWTRIYQDDRHVIFLRNDCPENREVLREDPTELIYPDDLARKLSIGLRYCDGNDPARCAEGVRLLMSIDKPVPRRYVNYRDFVPGLCDLILEYGIKVDMHDEIAGYLDRAAAPREPCDDVTADRTYLQMHLDACGGLYELALMQCDYAAARHYFAQAKEWRERYRKPTSKRTIRKL